MAGALRDARGDRSAMGRGAPLLSVVMPLLNEEDILWRTCGMVAAHLDRVVGAESWQFVPVDNGSTDGTPETLIRVAERWPATRPIRLNEKNIGRAIRAGLKAAAAQWAYVLPIDEFDVRFLEWAWRHRIDYDLILGSKRLAAQRNRQTIYRRVLSWGLNAGLRVLAGNVTADTHGQKLLYRPAFDAILDRTVMDRGQFDTELTIRAVRSGLRVAEIPVDYEEKRPPRNLMVTKIGRNAVDLLRLSWALRSEHRSPTIRYRRLTRAQVEKGSGGGT